MIMEKLYAWFKEGTVTFPSFLFSHYKTMGLNEQDVMLLMQLQNFIESGNGFPTPSQLSERMTFQESECLFLIQRLMQRGFIKIEEENTQSVGHESYSLEPFYEKMLECFLMTIKQQETGQEQEKSDNLYTVFEQEFGRPLSPFECETLAMWMEDEHHPDIIKAALRESVISGKLNFRYIDRILFEWKKNGVKTLDQAKSQGQKFRSYQKKDKKTEPYAADKDVPFYNWLEQ
ncbi:DnaD domain protein [Actinomycetes bacterium NPDC127524]|uniref:DnaD domain-containing protein n=1 Tax=Bacillus sp. OV322 TaxID=1882764 RepID=UPI0008EE76FF|nr:DnaD domain-containing protein [Bacillus sp. OV322]SFC45694.1 DNA replication protein DnaD [Bacillus sp. OV322]